LSYRDITEGHHIVLYLPWYILVHPHKYYRISDDTTNTKRTQTK